MRLLLTTAVFVLLLGSASAWDWDAHRYIARQALAPLLQASPECASAADQGSVFPDNVSKDTINHHCYDSVCPINDSNYCPQKIDCPALEKARRWVVNSTNETGCEKIFSLAVATHYASDAVNVMHKLRNEDYEGCHAPFEDKVGNAVKKNPDDFSVTQCCNAPKQCFSFSANDLKQVIAFVQQQIGLQNSPTPSVQPTSSPQPPGESTLSGLFESNKEIILIFLAILLFLYLFFKRKRR